MDQTNPAALEEADDRIIHESAEKTEQRSQLRLKDLIKVPIQDICLVHRYMDTKPVGIASLGPNTLTEMGKQVWADVLYAPVVRIFHGDNGIQVECTDIDPERLAQFSRSEHVRGARLAERAIYSITEDGTTRNYTAPNRGSILSAAKLLHALEDMKRCFSDESPVSVLKILDMEYTFVDFKGKTVSLLHFMNDEAFLQAMERIECGEREDVCVKMDFDTNRIRLMNLGQGESYPALPVTTLVDVYDQSLHNKNGQPYVNEEQFERLLAKLCRVQTEGPPLEERTDAAVPEFKMGL